MGSMNKQDCGYKIQTGSKQQQADVLANQKRQDALSGHCDLLIVHQLCAEHSAK